MQLFYYVLLFLIIMPAGDKVTEKKEKVLSVHPPPPTNFQECLITKATSAASIKLHQTIDELQYAIPL